MEETIEIARLSVQSCVWPLYEVENGKWKLNYNPKNRKKSLEEYIKPQGRFAHLLKGQSEAQLARLQQFVDGEWEALLERCGEL